MKNVIYNYCLFYILTKFTSLYFFFFDYLLVCFIIYYDRSVYTIEATNLNHNKFLLNNMMKYYYEYNITNST